MARIANDTLELLSRGQEDWNSWARTLIAEKADLEKFGKYALKNTAKSHEIVPANEETASWLERSEVLFRRGELPDQLDFTGVIFPGPAIFDSATLNRTKFTDAQFHGVARFNSAKLTDVSFNGSIFNETAWFNKCEATGRFLDFSGIECLKDLWFQAKTVRRAGFYRADIKGNAYFNDTKFIDSTNIEWCNFHNEASFRGVEFNGKVTFHTTQMASANFSDSKFGHQTIMRGLSARDLHFDRAKFADYMDLRDIRIARACSFRSLDAVGEVDLAGAQFRYPPDFTLSTFRSDPRLDNLTIRSTFIGCYTRPPTGLDYTERKPKKFWIDEDAPAKFRTLKRMAVAAHDTTREIDFHAQEIRASRFVTDFPIPWYGKTLSGVFRFWFGLAYGLSSNFGRSVLRPILLWLAVIGISTGLYLGQHPQIRADRVALSNTNNAVWSYSVTAWRAWQAGTPCAVSNRQTAMTNAAQEALQLAALNAMVFADGGVENQRRIYSCLYGLEDLEGKSTSPALVPPWVNWISRMQRTASALFIFLFGLGIRNLLRMK